MVREAEFLHVVREFLPVGGRTNIPAAGRAECDDSQNSEEDASSGHVELSRWFARLSLREVWFQFVRRAACGAAADQGDARYLVRVQFVSPQPAAFGRAGEDVR